MTKDITILTACVTRMKASGLKGKARDDAAAHFMAGVNATRNALDEAHGDPTPFTGKYVDVLEALADAS